MTTLYVNDGLGTCWPVDEDTLDPLRTSYNDPDPHGTARRHGWKVISIQEWYRRMWERDGRGGA